MTIPTIDWVAKLGAEPQRSWRASRSPSTARRPATTGSGSPTPATASAPTASSSPATIRTTRTCRRRSRFQQAGCSTWSAAGAPTPAGGLRYYILDNEPSIWHSTHRDVHPTGATMDEVRDEDASTTPRAIKDVDPGALVVGPEEWGWSGYFYSGYDQQYGAPARLEHPARSRQPRRRRTTCRGCSTQLRQRSTATGRRLLDVFTVHYYPQGGEFSDDVSTAMQLRRNRSTRSLWDPNYVDETWINDRVQLIPRLQGLGEQRTTPARRSASPNTTGAPKNHINGATTQADIFGIFGREGLDMAARWTTPAATHADLQGDEDVPQLRRQPIDVRRHERRGGDRRIPTTSRRSPPSARATAR